MNCLHSLAFYLWKMIFPVDLAALYPLDLRKTFSPSYVFSSFGVVVLYSACGLYRKKYPWLSAAGLYYLIILWPVLGLVQMGSQAAADRYVYLACIAPFLLFSSALSFSLSGRPYVFGVVAAILAMGMAYGTIQQGKTWRDNTSLWEQALRAHPRNSQIAHANLAYGYLKTGRFEEALVEFDRGIRIGPPSAFTFDWKGVALMQLGRVSEAMASLDTALQLEPRNPRVHLHLGWAFERMKRPSAALEEFEQSVWDDPDFSDGYYEMGWLYLDQGKMEKAKQAFQRALQLDPDNCTVWAGLGVVDRY